MFRRRRDRPFRTSDEFYAAVRALADHLAARGEDVAAGDLHTAMAGSTGGEVLGDLRGVFWRLDASGTAERLGVSEQVQVLLAAVDEASERARRWR